MAAFAAVLTVYHKLDLFLPSSPSKSCPETQSIHVELRSMINALKNYSSMQGRKLRLDPLEQQIEDLAEKITDLMEHEKLNDEEDLTTVPSELIDLVREFTFLSGNFIAEASKIEENKEAPGPRATVSSKMICKSECELVGLEEETKQVMDWVVGGPYTLEGISIVGMVGIGKTTLVEQVYNHPSTMSLYDTRIMVIVGPDFEFNEFLQLLVDHIEGAKRKRFTATSELSAHVRKLLEKRRYLLVLDDVWDYRIWHYMERCFPRSYDKCRIIVTTRLLSVACGAIHVHKKCFLDDDDSWNLLRRTVFTSLEESCSFQLEKIGKKIANNCEGLPLAIISIGRILRDAEKTVEYWEKISEDENPLGIDVDDNSNITRSLLLSYDMLPRYQKACFLYAGVFPRSYVIYVSELIRLWAIEGFVVGKNLVSVGITGEAWLEELISASVVLVHQKSSTFRKTKTCRIHYVFRNLCISIAEKEKFCHVLRKYKYSFPRGTNLQRRLCSHSNSMLGIEEVRATIKSILSIGSLLCLGPYHPYPLRLHLSFTLLKILNARAIRFFTFPCEILKLVRLKYLAITYDGELPNSISQLQKLQVLIIRRHIYTKLSEVAYLPVGIWNLKHLWHLHCLGLDLPEPCNGEMFLHNLKTLSGVSARSCRRRILARLPNLLKLGIRIVLGQDEKQSFGFLNIVGDVHPYLESFKCIVFGFNGCVVLELPSFPRYSRKITLSGCKFPWKFMAAIHNFWDLRVLKLRCNSFCGRVWEPFQGELPRLEYLLLEDLDMEVWKSCSGNFPKLRRIFIRHCYKLREIPIDFGNIESLELIEVEDCHPLIATSAKMIKENHQKMFRYKNLQVLIHSSWEDKK
ncbi:putative late blight resistance protein homolog R1A-10 [Andrographis paniculata]|uniref:putative late blight resistance protein homolog R1A-10 n=1 Tax=Andrographis paniculata TaxID=175694 RepID=UPI0021E935D8|nr:putative late blight resistance protein homolog R1A-10 [Andrographis paniculata]